MDDYSDDSSFLDTYYDDNDSGRVAYGDPDSTAATTGGVINSSVTPLLAPPDAGGGAGSYLSSLQDTLTNGLASSADTALEYGLGSLVDRLTVNANRSLQPAAAPSVRASASLGLGSVLSSPMVWIGALALVAFLVVRK